MGSLFSSPKIPTAPSVQYVAPSTSINPTLVGDGTNTENKNDNDEAVKDVIRRASRGRASTIQTSFRGVLGETNSLAPQRKSLLGE